jgi:AraC-like DNA-binding protein
MLKNLLSLLFLLIISVKISAKGNVIRFKSIEPKMLQNSPKSIEYALIQITPNESQIKFNTSPPIQQEVSVVKNITILTLITALVILYFCFSVKQKKQFLRFKSIIRQHQSSIYEVEKAQETYSDFPNISVETIENDQSKKRSESLMTSETEAKLLELLEDFEKGILYNNKNMSLPFLAGELSTNTKYLSYIINQHKTSDFKTYINRLRINYIIEKLASDEKYRQYKISILAEECGFSSHSKFAAVFKSVTEMSPSVYIKHLEEDKYRKNVYFQENR